MTVVRQYVVDRSSEVTMQSRDDINELHLFNESWDEYTTSVDYFVSSLVVRVKTLSDVAITYPNPAY